MQQQPSNVLELSLNQALNIANEVHDYKVSGNEHPKIEALASFVEYNSWEEGLQVLNASQGHPKLLRRLLDNIHANKKLNEIPSETLSQALEQDDEIITDIANIAQFCALEASQIDALISHQNNWHVNHPVFGNYYLIDPDERAIYLITSGILIDESNASPLLEYGTGANIALLLCSPKSTEENWAVINNLSIKLGLTEDDVISLSSWLANGFVSDKNVQNDLTELISAYTDNGRTAALNSSADAQDLKVALLALGTKAIEVCRNDQVLKIINELCNFSVPVTARDFKPDFLYASLANFQFERLNNLEQDRNYHTFTQVISKFKESV